MSHSRSPEVGVEIPVDGEDPIAAGVEADLEADAGMSTVEYAVGTIAAAAFAAVLYRIVTGDSVVSGLTRLIDQAFTSL